MQISILDEGFSIYILMVAIWRGSPAISGETNITNF